jgi:hypothetical protein
VRLSQPETVTALLRFGFARGWTGRTGPLHVDDATPLLAGLPVETAAPTPT